MREGPVKRTLSPRSALVPTFAVIVVVAVACSGPTTPGGGLLVVMSVGPSLDAAHLTGLSVDIGPFDGGTAYRDAAYPIGDVSAPNDVHFPTSLGIDSNGDPNASVAITLGVWDGTQAVDVELYRVENIPTTSTAELRVVFGSSGAAPVPGCTLVSPHSWLCIAERLGTDSGEPSPPADAAGDTVVDQASDTGAVDSTLADAGDAGGFLDRMDAADAPLNIPCDAPCGAGYECVEGHCAPVPPSCSGGGPGAGLDCGSGGSDDCCASDEVRSGTFYRGYDNETFTDMSWPASVSQFRLDRYEVTVGRFRQFVNTVSAGDASPAWAPAPSSGKHTHLNGGSGLSNGGDAAVGYEEGWDDSWNVYLPQTQADWDTQLQRSDCFGDSGAGSPYWTPASGANENLPINCLTWYEAYAFCIWDGAFLPSETEWTYAAAGGANQFVYAWGNDAPAQNSKLAVYDCFYPPQPTSRSCGDAPVGYPPGGAGLWGQLDLTGNVFEYVLDYALPYPLPCVDCATTSNGDQRVINGGGFDSPSGQLLNFAGLRTLPLYVHGDVGMRCARTPTP